MLYEQKLKINKQAMGLKYAVVGGDVRKTTQFLKSHRVPNTNCKMVYYTGKSIFMPIDHGVCMGKVGLR